MLEQHDERQQQPKRFGLLVEDETVAGGVDAQTGAPVIRPKDAAGKVDESTRPTDVREQR